MDDARFLALCRDMAESYFQSPVSRREFLDHAGELVRLRRVLDDATNEGRIAKIVVHRTVNDASRVVLSEQRDMDAIEAAYDVGDGA